MSTAVDSIAVRWARQLVHEGGSDPIVVGASARRNRQGLVAGASRILETDARLARLVTDLRVRRRQPAGVVRAAALVAGGVRWHSIARRVCETVPLGLPEGVMVRHWRFAGATVVVALGV